MNLLQLVFGLMASSFFAYSPPSKTSAPDPTVLTCATAELNAARLSADPKYAQQTALLEDEWANAAGRYRDKTALAPPYVLPIVFHIVHENGPENIPDADILRSVDYLNQALANTDYYDPATGVNTDIQVCLARRTPDNQPTNGINRIVSPLTDLNSDDDRDLKDLSRWEPRDYVNVWVVKEICGLGLGCGVAGYAYYPSAHGGSVDGIVLEARWLAGDEARVGVLIHELGHYLGLRHTFDGGCANDDCTRDGDRVCDTPPDQSTVAVPCTGSANSCSTDTNSGPFVTDQDDMFINYMDYGYFRCYSAFTAGQRERMHFFLEGRRRSLLESFGCAEPCPDLVQAGFTGGEVTVEVGATVNFTNTSVNGVDFVWRENRTVFSTTENASRTFSSEGTFQIQLFAGSANPALCAADSIRQTVRVICSVDPSFRLSGNTPRAGQPVTFTNTSTNGGQRRWLINGVLVSNDEDLVHTFPNPGFYGVCLVESNGFCEREYCTNVVVLAPPCQGPGCGGDTTSTGGCGIPLQLNYTSVGEEVFGNFSQIVPTGDGYVLGGTINDRAVVLRVGYDGSILWQRRFISEDRATITRLIIDRDGFVAGIGEDLARQTDRHFIFRIAPADGTVLWTKIIGSEVFQANPTELIQPGPGENYRCFGTASSLQNVFNGTEGGIYFEINPADGLVVGSTPKIYGRETGTAFEAAVQHPASGNYFVLGSSTGSPNGGTGASLWFITALNSTGSLLWVRQLFKNSDAADRSGLGLQSIQLDGDTIVLEGWSTNQNGTVAFKEIVQLNLAGEPLGNFGLYNTTTNSTESSGYKANKLLVNDAGYLVNDSDFNTLDFSFREHLTQLDRAGNVLWSKAYPGSFAAASHQGLALDGSSILLPVNSERIAGVLSVLRISPTGEASVCIPQDTAAAFTRPGVFRSTPIQLSTRETSLFTFDLEWGEGSLVPYALDCPEDCPEDENDDCTAPFRLQLTENDAVDNGIFTAVTSRDGIFYVGGRLNDLPYLAALRGNGEIIWQWGIASPGEQHTVRHLDFDDEGMLLGVSSLGPNNSPNPTIFRIDPATGNAAWVRRILLDNVTGLSKLLVTPAGGDYLLFGRNDASGVRNGFTVNIDRATGVPTGPPAIFPGATIGGFVDGVVDPSTGVAYLLSTTLQNTAPQARVTALDPNGGILWDKTYGVSQGEILTRSLNLIDGRLIVASALSGQSGRSAVLTLGLDGELERAVEHDYTGTSLSIQGITNRRNGDQLELLFYDAAASRWLLNREGFTILDILDNSRSRANWETDPLLTRSFASADNYLLVTGRNTLTGAPVLEALRVDSTSVAQACEDDFYFPGNYGVNIVDVVASDLPPVDATTSAALLTRPTELLPGSLTLATDNSCPQDCFPGEICDNQIDDDQDGLLDCDDPDLATTCCCLPSPTIDLGPDTLFCPGDVLSEGTDRQFAAYEWSTGARTDSIVIAEAGTYWLVVTDSCGRTASDTLTLHPRARPLLELGPDTTLCANAILPFLAQDGFANYEWTDGTTEKDFTAFEAGTYWVVATDSCGGVQTDTVRVNIDPATVIDLGRDTTICPGDVLTFRVDGFSDYQWSQSSFIDCFDCPEVRFAPTSDTLLLLAAQQGPGCFSSDSIRVRIASTVGSRDSVFLCPGDSVVFAETAIFNQGQYFGLQQVDGCERTDTLDVFTLRDTLTSEVFTICAGDSVLVFGTYVREALLDSRVYPAGNGCDSTHRIEVVVAGTIRTAETISTCAGDSSLIFGVFRQDPGVYTQTFTSSTGCDSTHAITLEVNEIRISLAQIRPDCGGANAGWGEVLFESDGFFEVRWSDGSFFKRNERLFADIVYTVTVTDGNGCSVVDSLVVDATVPPVLQTYVIDESCPGANDGEVGILHDRDDLRFSLEDGPYLAESSFQNLGDGTYRISVLDGDGCTSRLDLEVGGGVPYVLELPEQLFINLGDSVVLIPNTDFPPAEIRWNTDGESVCDGCPVLHLRPGRTTRVTAIVGDNENCETTAEVRITVNREELFYVPNAFSPNGDGLNDVFRVFPGPGVTRILSFEVFDRWGGRVFQRAAFAPEDDLGHWDGRLEGGRDPGVGVYVYQVRVELFTGEIVSRAGEVVVMR